MTLRRLARGLGLLLLLPVAPRPARAATRDVWSVPDAHVSHYDEWGTTYSGTATVPYWTASCGPDYLGATIVLWDGSAWHCDDRGGAVADGDFDLFAPGDYGIDAAYNGTTVTVED